ncbi:MAG: SufE family protein [Bacteroidales bacterium]|nr:SufE family protein [Bacteroidales bacterium]MDZ4205055.1 SufE family protein [Bacteroidales bacterium]
MSKTVEDIEKEIVAEFDIYDDWLDRYNYLIEIGKYLPLIDPTYKIESNLIHGCQSRVWLHAEMQDGRVVFSADSDAVITRGIISLLIRALSNQTPDDIMAAPLKFITLIGLKEHLSPSRSNGLISMVKQMKFYALAFKSK